MVWRLSQPAELHDENRAGPDPGVHPQRSSSMADVITPDAFNVGRKKTMSYDITPRMTAQEYAEAIKILDADKEFPEPFYPIGADEIQAACDAAFGSLLDSTNGDEEQAHKWFARLAVESAADQFGEGEDDTPRVLAHVARINERLAWHASRYRLTLV
jgi:hypothetical protein